MITVEDIIDAITYRDTGHIEVREATIVKRDGAEIARTLHRHVVAPGDDVSNEDPRVQAIAETLWTPELIAAYRAAQEANSLPIGN